MTHHEKVQVLLAVASAFVSGFAFAMALGAGGRRG